MGHRGNRNGEQEWDTGGAMGLRGKGGWYWFPMEVGRLRSTSGASLRCPPPFVWWYSPQRVSDKVWISRVPERPKGGVVRPRDPQRCRREATSPEPWCPRTEEGRQANRVGLLPAYSCRNRLGTQCRTNHLQTLDQALLKKQWVGAMLPYAYIFETYIYNT